MRIIAGVKRGMKLFSPEDDVSRPILDRVKQSLFDVLYNYNLPEDSHAADLFCGVGSLGLEALSRGASSVTFIENDRQTAKILKKNIEKAAFTEKSTVYITDALNLASLPLTKQPKFNLVFIDPPYILTKNVDENSPLDKLLKSLVDLTADDVLIVVRTRIETELRQTYGIFRVLERRTWGSMAVTFLGRTKK